MGGVMRPKLTPKQACFVNEYLVDLNATQAAIRAGYSAKTADRIGAQLLGKTWVCEAVQEGQRKRAERTELTADQVIEDLRRLATKAEAADEYSPAVRAVELQGKHLGMFAEIKKHVGADGGAIEHRVTVTYRRAGNG